jgi:hypothetical protein
MTSNNEVEMLELIVLGQIPGTDFHLNFTAVLAIAAGLLLLGELRYRLKHQKTRSLPLDTPGQIAL